MDNPILDLCQKIHGWDNNSPYEILEAKRLTVNDSGNEVISIMVEVRSKKEEEEEK